MTRSKRRRPPAPGRGGARVLPGQPARFAAWLPWILAAVAAVVFAQVVRFGFVHWDDHAYVFDNPYLKPVSLASVLHFWGSGYHGLYAPVTFSVHALQALAFGMDGGRFHLVNVLLHAANVALVYLLLRRLLGVRAASAAPILAACAALVFAVHPLQVESVAWVTGLKELLSTFFALLALYGYFGASGPQDGARRLVRNGTVWYLLALLSKPTTVVLGPVALILDIVVRGTPWRRALHGIWPWLAIAVPFAIVAKLLQPDAVLNETAPLWLRPFVAADALGFYITKIVVPVRLAPEYGRTPQWLLETGTWRWSWLVFASLAAAASWLAYRRARAPLGLLAAFAVALLPVLGLVPFPMQNWSTVTDHYAYFPLFLVALGVGLLLAEVPEARRALAVGVVVVAAAGLAALSVVQSRVWRSDDTLFPYAIARNPTSVILRINYAEALYGRGEVEDSLAYLREAASIKEETGIYNNMAVVLVELGRFSEAREALQRALALNPADEGIRANLAALEQRQKQGPSP